MKMVHIKVLQFNPSENLPKKLGNRQHNAYRAQQQKEVDDNYKIFIKKYFTKLFKKHPEEYALMKNGNLLDVYADMDEAIKIGNQQFDDQLFSVHRITKEVIVILG